MRNLFAYTEPPSPDHFYPAYISVNETDDHGGIGVSITVRSRDSQTGQVISMPHDELLALADTIRAKLRYEKVVTP